MHGRNCRVCSEVLLRAGGKRRTKQTGTRSQRTVPLRLPVPLLPGHCGSLVIPYLKIFKQLQLRLGRVDGSVLAFTGFGSNQKQMSQTQTSKSSISPCSLQTFLLIGWRSGRERFVTGLETVLSVQLTEHSVSHAVTSFRNDAAGC